MGINAVDVEWADLAYEDRQIIRDALERVGVFTNDDLPLSQIMTGQIRSVILAAANSLRLVPDSQQYFSDCIDAVYAAAYRRRQ